MEKMICQSCGMPLGDPGFFGTNADESRNEDYCIYCYAMGNFTNDFTMEEMIEHNLEFLDVFNADSPKQFSADEAREEMMKFFPTLKRWK